MGWLQGKRQSARRRRYEELDLLARLAEQIPDRLVNTPFLPPAPLHKRWRWQPSQALITVLIVLAFILAVHLIATSRIAPASDTDLTSCTSYLSHLDYTKYVRLRSGQQMAAIQLTRDITGGLPSALVQVNENDPQQRIDLYLYGCHLEQGTPTLKPLFQQQGLTQGTVTITPQHTLVVGLLDTTLKAEDNDMLLIPQQQNVYREYAWQNGTLQQIIFPSLYPVTSRSEAIALQNETNQGQSAPWNDPLTTAEQMAHDLFNWQSKDITGTIQDNNAVDAHVQLEQKGTHQRVLVSLSRLIQHDSHGLWFVIGAQTAGITLDQSTFAHTLTSPITLQGSLATSHTPIKVTLFTHALNPISIQSGNIIQPDADNTFKGSITYAHIFPDQSGLLLLQTQPDTTGDTSYLYLTNVLLS